MFTSIKTNVSARLAAGAVGAAMIVSLGLGATPALAAGLTSAQVQSILSLLSSFGADQATINNVNGALTGQATTGTTSSTSTVTSTNFTRDLTVGSTGDDVKALQQYLNANGFTVSTSGAGSVGNESSYFGSATKAALMKFQAAKGITPVAGYFGAKTRAAIGGTTTSTTTTTTDTTTTTTTGTGISVSMAAQPANSLAPQGSARVPFTTFTLSNNTANAVTVSSVTVQRAGLAQDAAFSGVVLIDQNGLQVGIAHTFNSNHQTNIGDNFTIAAGQSMTYTVSGNMASDLSSYTGQIAQLQVVAINTSASVTGSLPITGASQTLNSSLSVGAVSTSTSSYDPAGTQSKNIGDTNVRFSGVRFTASSAEDLKLFNIRWRQTGTASAADISNVMTYVNGTAYPTTVDSTGKYYTAVFTGGITITKGNSVDVYVQGDVSGTNSASRTVVMNIDKVTDVYFVGQLYGYGIAPSGTYTPWYSGYTTNISGGSVTTIQNASSVSAANVPVNVNNTVLGGFQTNFLGEPVSVTQMVFTVTTSSGTLGASQMTSVSIVDENGTVVAGPVDATSYTGATQTLTFSDTVTFPVGLHTYTLKGKVPSASTNNTAFYLSTTPSSWSSPTGQTTGNTVSITTSAITMNTMTVKGAVLTITAAPNPVAQNIVAGNAVTLANIQLDASQSGEDIRLNNLPMIETGTAAAVSYLNSCQLYNGSTVLNTGGNVINSVTNNGTTAGTYSSGSATTFTFDNALTVPKGTVTTLSLKCNISTGISANNTIAFGVYASATYSATGLLSGNSLGSNVSASTGFSGTQTVSSSGTFTLAVDSSTPSYSISAGGTSGVNMGVYKLRASNETVNLTKVALTLANSSTASKATSAGSQSYAAQDMTQVYLYNGSTLLGTATFTGTGTTATSSLTTTLSLPKDTDVYITVKADLAGVGSSMAGGIGDLIKVDPTDAQGSGASSGQTVNITASGNTYGVQTFKTYPTIAFIANSATNPNGVNQVLKKFSVTANSNGAVGLFRLTATMATSSANVTDIKLYGYTDSGFSQGISGTTGGLLVSSSTAYTNAPTIVLEPTTSAYGGQLSNVVQVPAGTTYYFAVLGTVTPSASATNWSVNTTISGDSAAPSALTSTYRMGTTTAIKGGSSASFIWSDNASTTATSNDVDWTNGYYVPGLSAAGF